MCGLMNDCYAWLLRENRVKTSMKLEKNLQIFNASRARHMFFAAATPSRARQKAVAAAKGLRDFGSKLVSLRRGRDDPRRGRDTGFSKFFVFFCVLRTELVFDFQHNDFQN
jgi:hypothetical protein